jgi:hypothetical protein
MRSEIYFSNRLFSFLLGWPHIILVGENRTAPSEDRQTGEGGRGGGRVPIKKDIVLCIKKEGWR